MLNRNRSYLHVHQRMPRYCRHFLHMSPSCEAKQDCRYTGENRNACKTPETSHSTVVFANYTPQPSDHKDSLRNRSNLMEKFGMSPNHLKAGRPGIKLGNSARWPHSALAGGISLEGCWRISSGQLVFSADATDFVAGCDKKIIDPFGSESLFFGGGGSFNSRYRWIFRLTVSVSKREAG